MENKKNTAVSTPEMVTISRAEYDSQQAQLTELKLQNQWLLEQLGLAKKRQFGTSSEHLQEGLMDQLSLMANEAEAYAYGTKNATAEQVAVKAHARKRQSGSVLDIVPEGTPTEVVEHRLCEEERTCDTCGAVMEEIGKEVRRSLKMEPARFWIREDVYYTYACKQCEAETGEGRPSPAYPLQPSRRGPATVCRRARQAPAAGPASRPCRGPWPGPCGRSVRTAQGRAVPGPCACILPGRDPDP